VGATEEDDEDETFDAGGVCCAFTEVVGTKSQAISPALTPALIKDERKPENTEETIGTACFEVACLV
jgi:hypothetical protein